MNVKNFQDLQKALSEGEREIVLENAIAANSSIRLAKGQSIRGAGENTFLSFINGDGLALAGENSVKNLTIQTSTDSQAIFLDASDDDLGEISLENLTITGNAQFLMRAGSENLKISAKNIDIVAADARKFPERPMKYGVNVYQGAFTIYNFNPSESSLIEANLENISVGRENSPVIGSGIFISGFGDEGGKVEIESLITGEVYSNGMIPFGQPNLITGGIFIVYGANVRELKSRGVVKTYGVNDMVLDVWGSVESWILDEKVESFGPSGIGFVNFGEVGYFEAKKPIITRGLGARGFNQYDGTISEAIFDSIETFGDGAIGMQFSKPVGRIIVRRSVKTHGETGETLVKGVIKTLKAEAISVLEGGKIDVLEIGENIETGGENLLGYNIDGGEVGEFKLGGEIINRG